jgi:hypothetical protein
MTVGVRGHGPFENDGAIDWIRELAELWEESADAPGWPRSPRDLAARAGR